MINKLLTIVVPVYNTEQYLDKCLSSLVSIQYMDKLEVLIIIDGSPDNSISIARKYEVDYPQTFIIIDKENGGHGSCCNVGLKKAQGKYIRFLDSDDWMDEHDYPLYLKTLHDIDADLIQTNFTKDYNGLADNKTSDLYRGVEDKLWNADEFEFSKFNYFLTIPNSTFKTECLRASGIVFTEKAPFDDTILYVLPLTNIKTLYCSNLCVYHYYIGRVGQSVSSTDIEKKIPVLSKEFKKLCESYVEIRDTLSVNKIAYADKIVNYIIANNFYRLLLRTKYVFAHKYADEWNEYVRSMHNLPFFQNKKISYYGLYNMFGYYASKYIYFVIRVFKRIKMLMHFPN